MHVRGEGGRTYIYFDVIFSSSFGAAGLKFELDLSFQGFQEENPPGC